MEDEEVYSENDPLTIYLKSHNINDFEVYEEEIPIVNDMLIKTMNKDQHKHSNYCQELQKYIEEILKCELLFEEDYAIIESNNCYVNSTIIPNYGFVKQFVTLTSIAISWYYKYKMACFICSVSVITWNVYAFYKRYRNKNKIAFLLRQLHDFTGLTKRCLVYLKEMSVMMNYFNRLSQHRSALDMARESFAVDFHERLLTIINILIVNSNEIISKVPLKSRYQTRYTLSHEILKKTNVNLNDMKVIYEFYLLVQSDFLKTVSLSLCETSRNCDKNIDSLVFRVITSVSKEIRYNVGELERAFEILRNFGKNKVIKKPPKTNSKWMYIDNCIYNSELHFQQLAFKAQDLRNLTVSTKTDPNKILLVLSEMEQQIDASKTMIEAAMKHLNNLFKDTQTPVVVEPNKKTVQQTTECSQEKEEEEKPRNEVYELYIPKEGLDFNEDIEQEIPVCSFDNILTNRMLMKELKMILKTRNPDMFSDIEERSDTGSGSEVFIK